MKRGWIIVFAKAPIAGRVKTRFSPPFSPVEAAAFYRCLLGDVLEVTGIAAARFDLEAVLCVDPPGEAARLAAEAPPGFRAIAQAPGPLGERMARAAQCGIATGASFVLLRGSDSPCLDAAAIGSAVDALARSELVASPDRDGGYNLVGVAARSQNGRSLEALFDHPMSTPEVLRDTLANAAKLGMKSERLAPGFDLDRFDDLRVLASVRHGPASSLCPRTLAFLDEHGLWPPPASVRSDAAQRDR